MLDLPLMHADAIFRAHALPKRVWVVNDVQVLRNQTDFPGEMVSPVQDEHRVISFPNTVEELARVNDVRGRRVTLKVSKKAVFPFRLLLPS